MVPSFHTWFVQYETDLFKRYLIKEVTLHTLMAIFLTTGQKV